MDWKAHTGTDMLKRIVALLLALADLAEQAANRSPAVRWQVLSHLLQAHDVARVFVTDRASNAAGGMASATTGPHDPVDAMALAASLRTLALLLGTMAARMRRSLLPASGALRRDGNPPRHRYVVGPTPSLQTAAIERLDTS